MDGQRSICDIVGDTHIDGLNAAFIVRACNSHDELMVALRLARGVVAGHAEFSDDADELEVLHKIDRAIANADGA